ncbi:MAG TPA: GxxExxY protein [Vicinamibacterales bacterium]
MNHEGNHEGRWRGQHEAHEASLGEFRMRRKSPLEPEADRLMTHTIGCAIAVHRALGPGFLESIYRKAMCVELEARGLPYEVERPVCVSYRGVDIPGQRIDLIVGGLIVVELKTVVRFDRVHVAQVISYLKTTGLRGGLLINFRVPLLVKGLKRIVL